MNMFHNGRCEQIRPFRPAAASDQSKGSPSTFWGYANPEAGAKAVWCRGIMPHRKRISEFDRKIENLRVAIGALRRGKASADEIDRALSDLARVKAERLRLMLHQVNLGAERRPQTAAATGGPRDHDASAVQSSNSEG